jgi:hypothetical protein
MRVGRIASGAWLCLALAVFGGAILVIFFRAAHRATGSSAARDPLGVPSRSLKLAALNLHGESSLPDATARLVRQDDPDFLFLHEVRGKDIRQLQKDLGSAFVAAAYYPLQNLPSAAVEIGDAILAKAPLADARPIPNHMSGAAGVWASATIDGRRFFVASLRLSEHASDELSNFVKAWKSLHEPPIIAAADSAPSRMPEIHPLTQVAEDPTWLLSNDWRPQGPHRDDPVHRLTVGPSQSR